MGRSNICPPDARRSGSSSLLSLSFWSAGQYLSGEHGFSFKSIGMSISITEIQAIPHIISIVILATLKQPIPIDDVLVAIDKPARK
jgi:hypothetical protein